MWHKIFSPRTATAVLCSAVLLRACSRSKELLFATDTMPDLKTVHSASHWSPRRKHWHVSCISSMKQHLHLQCVRSSLCIPRSALVERVIAKYCKIRSLCDASMKIGTYILQTPLFSKIMWPCKIPRWQPPKSKMSVQKYVFSFITRNAWIISPINVLKLNTKLGIADRLVPSTCLYLLWFFR